jgi:hypothetical protein
MWDKLAACGGLSVRLAAKSGFVPVNRIEYSVLQIRPSALF